MRLLFLVQGEGRGHLTQALALAPMLRRAGHEVVAVLVGTPPQRVLPAFFGEEIGAPVVRFTEPAFGYGAAGVQWGTTLAANVRRLPGLAQASGVIRRALAHAAPDVVVNFYSLMGGLYGRLYGFGVPVVCVGHQYAFHHPVYPFPEGEAMARRLAQGWTHLTVPPGARRLALSFYEAHPVEELNLRVVPPLLRDAVRTLNTGDDGYLLAYLLNAAHADALASWATSHPDVRLHLFRHTPDAPTSLRQGNLTLHRLDGQRFLAGMAWCRALVCTAGFESVCEALYLGKPALMVPVARHFEQTCNARDAERFGAGLFRRTYDLDALIAFADRYTPVPGFRAWADSAEAVFVEEIEAAAGQGLRAPAAAWEVIAEAV